MVVTLAIERYPSKGSKFQLNAFEFNSGWIARVCADLRRQFVRTYYNSYIRAIRNSNTMRFLGVKPNTDFRVTLTGRWRFTIEPVLGYPMSTFLQGPDQQFFVVGSVDFNGV